MKAYISIDGGARPTNPGHAGCAVVVQCGRKTVKQAFYIGWKTNNEAEYHGLIQGLRIARDLAATSVEVRTDSKLIFGHHTQGWRVKAETLKPLLKLSSELFELFETWGIRWVPREENSECDGMCTEIIKSSMSDNPFTMLARKSKSVDLVGSAPVQ